MLTTALREMDHVIAVVYEAPLTTEIPAATRADWIREAAPAVEVIIAHDGPEETGYTPEIIEKQNNYLRKLLADRKIDAFYSSEPYGEFVSAAFGCRNRQVDPGRSRWPVSATMIRENPQAFKDFLPEAVFASLKPKLYFIGAPSTGKTTLSRYCAEILDGNYCAEYGRDYWFKFQKQHRLSMEDLEAIAAGHTRQEDGVCREKGFLNCIDTGVITTLAYARYYFGAASPKLENIFRENRWRYRHVFLCAEDIAFEDSWDRSGPQSRGRLQKINLEILAEHQIPYTVLAGTVEERATLVQNYLKEQGLWQTS